MTRIQFDIITPDPNINEFEKGKKYIIRKIREQVEKWMPENDGEENTHGERTAFNSVLNLLKELENE